MEALIDSNPAPQHALAHSTCLVHRHPGLTRCTLPLMICICVLKTGGPVPELFPPGSWVSPEASIWTCGVTVSVSVGSETISSGASLSKLGAESIPAVCGSSSTSWYGPAVPVEVSPRSLSWSRWHFQDFHHTHQSGRLTAPVSVRGCSI